MDRTLVEPQVLAESQAVIRDHDHSTGYTPVLGKITYQTDSLVKCGLQLCIAVGGLETLLCSMFGWGHCLGFFIGWGHKLCSAIGQGHWLGSLCSVIDTVVGSTLLLRRALVRLHSWAIV